MTLKRLLNRHFRQCEQTAPKLQHHFTTRRQNQIASLPFYPPSHVCPTRRFSLQETNTSGGPYAMRTMPFEFEVLSKITVRQILFDWNTVCDKFYLGLELLESRVANLIFEHFLNLGLGQSMKSSFFLGGSGLSNPPHNCARPIWAYWITAVGSSLPPLRLIAQIFNLSWYFWPPTQI